MEYGWCRQAWAATSQAATQPSSIPSLPAQNRSKTVDTSGVQ